MSNPTLQQTIEALAKEKGLEPEVIVAAIEEAVHIKLTFRCKVELIPEESFGASGYKTNLTVTRR